MAIDTKRRARRLALSLAMAVLLAACGGSGDGSDTAVEDDPVIDDTPTQPGDRAVQVLSADKTRIFGTLTVPPAAANASVPGALILPSAGPGDRNGTISNTSVPSGLGQALAGELTDAGLVTYRYDRRGTGESKLEEGTALTLQGQVDDAKSALDVMAQRKETQGKDLAVVGYEEGGLVALRVAASDPRVKRVVLVSTGRSLVDVQADRLGAAYGPESAEALRATVANLVVTGTLPPISDMRAELRPLLPPENAAYLAELYRFDTVAEAARVRVPALIVVPSNAAPYDAAGLAAALPGVQVITATGGPNLTIEDTTPQEDLSDPANPRHDHGASAPVAPVERDSAAFDRITGFLTSAP